MFNPFMWNRPPVEELGPQQAKKVIDSGSDTVILDVRTRQEYNGDLGHIKGSILIPLQALWHHQDEIEPYKDKEIIVVCRSGQRSAEACRILGEKGFKVKNMTGGMMFWNQLQFPVEY